MEVELSQLENLEYFDVRYGTLDKDGRYRLKKNYGNLLAMIYHTGTIDGKEVPIFRTDYTLRGLEIPAGKHSIEFRFEPQVVKTGSTIVLISGLGMALLIAAGIYLERKRKKTD